MALANLYVLHPTKRSLPGVTGWLDELREFFDGDADWQGWSVVAFAHDLDGGFRINDRYAAICSALGPALVIQPVQRRVSTILRDRLQPRVVVLEVAIACCEDIWIALADLRKKHDAGEPLLPTKYVAAMHVLWKLNREHRWGGNAKSYMWASDLPKGRGMPKEVADIVLEVASDLHQARLLGYKRSKTGIKYCLNADQQAVIYNIMDHPCYPDDRLPKAVGKCSQQVSARLLDDGIRLRAADRNMNPSASEQQDGP